MPSSKDGNSFFVDALQAARCGGVIEGAVGDYAMKLEYQAGGQVQADAF